MKLTYETPELNILNYQYNDVIATALSGGIDDGGDDPYGG